MKKQQLNRQIEFLLYLKNQTSWQLLVCQVSHNFTRCILSLVLYMLAQNTGAARRISCWASP